MAGIASSSAIIHRRRSRQRGSRRTGSYPRGQSTEQEAPGAAEVVKKFIEIHHAQSRPRWRKEQERLLTKHFLSRHKDTALNRITTKDILAITDGLKELPSE
jgi:hypothetical protein